MELWGEKTVAWFDVWSVEHFIAGMAFGSLWLWLARLQAERGQYHPATQQHLYVANILALAYLWEAVEFYIEAGYVWDRATYWMQGVEFIGNRLLTDPLLTLAGALAVQRKIVLRHFARIFTLLWLGTHIFVFPHSMYLHDRLTHALTGESRAVPDYAEWLATKPPKKP